MTDETLQATILNLKSQALGVLGLMKDMARRATHETDVGTLSNYAAQLAQLEGAMLTLQQYAPLIKTAGAEALALLNHPPEEEEVEEAAEEDAEEERQAEDPPAPLTEKELRERSPTFRKSRGDSARPPEAQEE